VLLNISYKGVQFDRDPSLKKNEINVLSQLSSIIKQHEPASAVATNTKHASVAHVDIEQALKELMALEVSEKRS
jgi:hypothetical protein